MAIVIPSLELARDGCEERQRAMDRPKLPAQPPENIPLKKYSSRKVRPGGNTKTEPDDMASLLEIAASADGTVDQIETFLRENPGANLNPVDRNGRTPLSLAAKGGRNDLVSRLLRESAVLRNHPDENGKTPLILAAETGQYQAVRLLSGDKFVKIDYSDNIGYSPLSYAAEHGHLEVVEWLLQQSVEVNSGTYPFARTPLLLALQNKHDSIVSLLIDKDMVSLRCLVHKGDQMLAEALMFAGYNVDTEFYGETALLCALGRANSAMVKFLLNCRASTKGITQDQWRRGLKAKDSQLVVISKYPSSLVKVDIVSFCMSSDWVDNNSLRSSYADGAAVKYVFRFHMTDSTSNMYPLRPDQSEIGATWVRSIGMMGNEGSPFAYFTTLPHGWIPDNEYDLMKRLVRYMQDIWENLCKQAKRHLNNIRIDQLKAEGKDPALMHLLAQHAYIFEQWSQMYKNQVLELKAFICRCRDVNPARQPPQSLTDLVEKLESFVDGLVQDLIKTAQKLMQTEFAWASVTEARASTKLGQHVMVLTYVNILYLPLAYCAEEDTRAAFIKTSAIVAGVTLFVALLLKPLLGVAEWLFAETIALARQLLAKAKNSANWQFKKFVERRARAKETDCEQPPASVSGRVMARRLPQRWWKKTA
ncbi:ankyrin repeat-containing [Cordyceps militaris]|uniref:Ankyrin repeat-containing n=1 Tax=Cordyceps militaris TaxID=73501 RepID=A0A2H4SVK1_CORMI|nr:ankyrin repeat-containing [Cordyceps militaris]